MGKAEMYRSVGNRARVEDAPPVRLVQLMFEGALARLAIARGQIERADYQGKGQSLGKAVSIISGLQQSLDLDRGGELAASLDALYDYVQRRLFRANVDNDVAVVDEVADLLRRLKAGWDELAGREVAR
jgi:flagellar protein FliS